MIYYVVLHHMFHCLRVDRTLKGSDINASWCAVRMICMRIVSESFQKNCKKLWLSLLSEWPFVPSCVVDRPYGTPMIEQMSNDEPRPTAAGQLFWRHHSRRRIRNIVGLTRYLLGYRKGISKCRWNIPLVPTSELYGDSGGASGVTRRNQLCPRMKTHVTVAFVDGISCSMKIYIVKFFHGPLFGFIVHTKLTYTRTRPSFHQKTFKSQNYHFYCKEQLRKKSWFLKCFLHIYL